MPYDRDLQELLDAVSASSQSPQELQRQILNRIRDSQVRPTDRPEAISTDAKTPGRSTK